MILKRETRQRYFLIGLFPAVCLFLGSGYEWYNHRFVTSRERKAAYQALYSLDNLVEQESSTKKEFLAHEAKTQQLIALAHTEARTVKDRTAANDLDFYLQLVQSDRAQKESEEAFEKLGKLDVARIQSDSKISESSTKLISSWRGSIVKILE